MGKILWTGAKHFSGRIFLTYDPKYFYLCAIVRKDTRIINDNNPSTLWNGDCVEMVLSTHSLDTEKDTFSRGDYYLGFSPGTDCGNPQMYCFNMGTSIVGGRIIARDTEKGYILEAAVPLSFFGGLDMGPGKTFSMDLALDEGGSVGGNRIVQMELQGNPLSYQDPLHCLAARWIGTPIVSVPVADATDYYADLVEDGTRDAVFKGLQDLKGRVEDEAGAPVAGAQVSTWPRTQAVTTDSRGIFELDRAKTYSDTLVYARLAGYGTSLATLPNGPASIELRLWKCPWTQKRSGQDWNTPPGLSISLSPGAVLPSGVSPTGPAAIPLPLLEFKIPDDPSLDPDHFGPVLDGWIAYAQQIRAQPVLELPIPQMSVSQASQWVAYCNVEKKYGVRYWELGDGPDASEMPGHPGYNAYDYINDFRKDFNAMKQVDPSIFVLGPGLDWRYETDENDWLTPFVRYDGDIADMVSVQRFAGSDPAACSARSITAELRGEAALIHELQDRMFQNDSYQPPLWVVGGDVVPPKAFVQAPSTPTPEAPTVTLTATPTPLVPDDQNIPQDAKGFWAALWAVDEWGILAQEGAGCGILSPGDENGGLGLMDGTQPLPLYWAYRSFLSAMKGVTIPCQVQLADLSAYAAKDPETGDLEIILINKSPDYYHPIIRLNGKVADVILDAGLDRRYDYEIPSGSLVRLDIKADPRSGPDESWLYTSRMAKDGKPPQETVLHAW